MFFLYPQAREILKLASVSQTEKLFWPGTPIFHKMLHLFLFWFLRIKSFLIWQDFYICTYGEFQSIQLEWNVDSFFFIFHEKKKTTLRLVPFKVSRKKYLNNASMSHFSIIQEREKRAKGMSVEAFI